MAASAGYDGFVSYSHAADARLATELQRGLHRFAKPWYRVRALRVFRDEASLSANPGLWSSIEQALEDSRYLILLASPEAASSEWVEKEAAYWRDHKSLSHLIVGWTDGELEWDEDTGDFDWCTTDVLPAALRGTFAERPRFVDLRWTRETEELSLSHPRFRAAVADIAAPLHGKPKDELESDEVREHRRGIRVARAAVAALALLTTLAVIAGIVARVARNQAITARDQAVAANRVSQSRALAGEASTSRAADPTQAALLSLEAYKSSPTFEARNAVVTSLESYTDAILRGHTGSVMSVAVSPDGSTIASGSADGTVRIWDAATGLSRGIVIHAPGPVDTVAFGPGGRTLVSGGQDTSGRGSDLDIWDVATGRALSSVPAGGAEVDGVALSRDGRELAFGTTDGYVYLWDTHLNKLVHSFRAATQNDGATIDTVALSQDGNTLAAIDNDGAGEPGGAIVKLWNAATGSSIGRLGGGFPAAFENVSAMAFSPDGGTLAVGDSSGFMSLWSMKTLSNIASVDGHQGPVTDVVYSPTGGVIASSSADGAVRLWSPATGQELGQPLYGGNGPVDAVALGVHDVLVSGNADGTLRLWDPRRFDKQNFSVLGLAVTGQDATSGGGELAFSSDGGALYAQDTVGDQTYAFNSHTGQELSGGAPDSVDFTSPDDATSVTGQEAIGHDDGTIDLGGNGVHAVLRGHIGAVNAVSFSPDGKLLASAGSDGTVRIWNVAARREQGAPLYGHSGEVDRVSFTADPGVVVSAGQDGTARLWDIRSGLALGQPLPLTPTAAEVPGAAPSYPNPFGVDVGLALAPDGRFAADIAADATEFPLIFPSVLTSRSLRAFEQILCPELIERLGLANPQVASVCSRPAGSSAPTALGSAVATIGVGVNPQGLYAGANGVWVVNHGDDTVSRIDPATGTVVGMPLAVERRPEQVWGDAGALWVTNDDGEVMRLDPVSGRVESPPTEVGSGCCALADIDGTVWGADAKGIIRLDPGSGAAEAPPVQRSKVDFVLAVGDGELWVESANGVQRLDPRSGQPIGQRTSLSCANGCGMAVGYGSVWEALSNGTVVRVNERTGEQVGASIGVGRSPYDVEAGFGSVWVSNQGDDTVSQIDGRTGRLIGTIQVGPSPGVIAIGEHAVWVADTGDDAVTEITP